MAEGVKRSAGIERQIGRRVGRGDDLAVSAKILRAASAVGRISNFNAVLVATSQTVTDGRVSDKPHLSCGVHGIRVSRRLGMLRQKVMRGRKIGGRRQAVSSAD